MTKLVRSFCILGALVGFIPFRELAAQGVTSAAVVGRVTDDAGQPIPSGSLTLTNTASGVRYLARSADDGRFFFENVQVGAYVLDARALGHEPGRVPDIVLTLGQRRVADVTLRRAAVQLGGVTVEAVADPLRSTSRTGASQFVSESLIARLPTLARNFTDFVETTPQIARTSAAGQNNRFNNIQIDGAVNNDLFGLGSTGQPGGQVGAKAIPIDAISQYQVLIAPFDVRQGGFTGGLINAITRRGTNQIHGSFFEYHQNNDLVGGGLTTKPFGEFTENQYGGSIGGPLLHDKPHIFMAGEGQGRSRPNSGANIGIDPIPATGINPDSAARFTNIFRTNYSAFDPGDFGQVTLDNPNTNLFGRLDWQVGQNHVLTFRHNYVKASDVTTSRGNNYSFASNNYVIRDVTNSSVLQLNSTFGGRLFNEVILGRETIRDKRDPNVTFPQVQVTVTSDTSATPNPAGRFTRTLVAGAEQFSQANRLDQDIYELTDNVTFGLSGGHRLTLGTHNESFHFTNLFIGQFTGLWTFTSLASFQSGTAASFTRTLPYPGTSTPIADFRVRQFGFYVQDQWDATPRLNLTYGVRLDVPTFPDQPRSNPDVQSVFQVNTQDVPSGNLLWSPRVGFNYDVTGDRNTVLRGGVGLFTGRPAYVWLSNAYGNSGRETVQLSCVNVPGRSDSVPAFTLDPSNQPSLCRNQTSLTATGLQTVNYFDKDFKFPQVWKADVAVDRDLPHGFLGTFEVLYSRTANAMLIRDRNIGAVASYARDGRPIYGTISGTGVVTTNFVDARFDKVLEHYNGGGDWSVSFTWQLQRRFANWLGERGLYLPACRGPHQPDVEHRVLELRVRPDPLRSQQSRAGDFVVQHPAQSHPERHDEPAVAHAAVVRLHRPDREPLFLHLPGGRERRRLPEPERQRARRERSRVRAAQPVRHPATNAVAVGGARRLHQRRAVSGSGPRVNPEAQCLSGAVAAHRERTAGGRPADGGGPARAGGAGSLQPAEPDEPALGPAAERHQRHRAVATAAGLGRGDEPGHLLVRQSLAQPG